MASKTLWNDGWRFVEFPLEDRYKELPENAPWKNVDIPHDYMIYDLRNLYRDSIGWYKKEFNVNEDDLRNRVSVRFDGVYMDSTIYVNGKQAYEWKYGYSTFEVDITEFLKAGANDILVRIVYQSLNTRWYSGAGIYRNVWLKKYATSHIMPDGLYVATQMADDGSFEVNIDTEICADDIKPDDYLEYTVTAPNSEAVQKIKLELNNSHLVKKTDATPDSKAGSIYGTCIKINDPVLWDIGQGNIYGVKAELHMGGKLIDSETSSFGLKDVVFDSEKGLILNGRHIKIYGACEHHDLGCLGAAFNKDAMRRKLIMLRSMGVNAIRTSHNMPAPELMELCDEMGFLVDSEAFDMWEMSKTPYDYARFFNDWCERDVRSWVRRDRNHACLLMWSIGNEIVDIQIAPRGREITNRLADAVKANDYRRNAPVTMGSNSMRNENSGACSDLLELAGYNYGEKLYEEHHKEHPNRVIYGSETASMLSSRGVYHFPAEQVILSDEDEQCSSLGNTVTGWSAYSFEDAIRNDRDAEFSLGQFIWTGFDYIGEPTPYNTKNSYFGQIDTAGFPKDAYYVYRSEWTDHKDAPIIHIYPHWDFNEGEMIDVAVITNAPELELFFDGESLGRRKIDHKHGEKIIQYFRLPYKRGTLMAKAYDENNTVIAQDVKSSFNDTDKLVVTADREEISANGTDLIFVSIQAVDENGVPVDNAKDRINVDVTGAGRLVGLDNGDSADYDEFKGKSKRLFSGRLLAVIASTLEPGEITLSVDCAKCGKKEYKYMSVKPVSPVVGVSACERNTDRTLMGCGSLMKELTQNNDEVPIRKLELTAPISRELTKENPSARISLKVLPTNATYSDIKWTVMNESGIEIDYATITTDENGAYVTATGDGYIKVRASAYNGGSCASVLSDIVLNASGIGIAYIKPYEDVFMGRYSELRGGAEEGLRHGIGFKGRENGCALFNYVDFGDFGTDEVTVSIFANTNDPVYFKLWEGDPADGGDVILDAKYHVKPDWMVFKEATYKLSKRLVGKCRIAFTSEYEFNYKSFRFNAVKKAFSKLHASDRSVCFGDSFTNNGTCIENIGNNVRISFDDMDFGTEGATKLTLCAHSPLAKSNITMTFNGADGVSEQTVTFEGCDEYTERTIDIETLVGKGTISFIFLPGSNFNLASIRFS